MPRKSRRRRRIRKSKEFIRVRGTRRGNKRQIGGWGIPNIQQVRANANLLAAQAQAKFADAQAGVQEFFKRD